MPPTARIEMRISHSLKAALERAAVKVARSAGAQPSLTAYIVRAILAQLRRDRVKVEPPPGE